MFTQPDETNVTVALGYAHAVDRDGTFILNFTGPDPRAYFPSTYSYVLAQTAGFDAGKGAALGKFLCYAVSQGQVIAPQLRYARLSAPLVKLAIGAIARIPGAPAADKCFIGTAQPPGLPSGVTINLGAAGGGQQASSAASAEAAAAQQAQAQQAAEAAALQEAAKRARLEKARQRSVDQALKNAASAASHTSSSSSDAIWIVLAGVFLAAAGSLALDIRRRTAS